ncbi:MAG: serine/threonine protein kinase [Kofleriaceae bacterium]
MKLCPKCQKQFSDDANFCPVDAARLIPLDAQPASGGDTLAAKFDLGDSLGGSRTGTVYRAKDKSTGAAVAVKVISPAVVALPGVAQRLDRELKQLERVQSAGVAKVMASGKRAGSKGEETWVATELVEGAQTLAEAITARGPIPLAEAAHLIEVIGEALIEAAQVGVVHRDLAPKNVLFAGGDIKLINFSVPVPTTERVPGVPEFVAPEQVDGKAVDQRSNLYNLGALYYYVLTGMTVHAGAVDEVHRAHVNGAIKTPSSLAPVPANVEAVIMRSLDRSPTKRFLTVRQFVDEVSRVARGESDPKSTQPMGLVKSGARPKAELVATLLGVNRGGGLAPTLSPAPNLAPTLVPSPVVGAAPAAVGTSTVIGVSLGPQTPATAATEPAQAMLAPTDAPTVSPAVLAAQESRSPWAPPGAQPAITEVAKATAATVVPPAAPVAPAAAAPAAPTLPAPPVVAAPVVAQPAAKKGDGKPASGGKKDAFRETMWFKKGDLDAQAAVAAAEERARTGKDATSDKADSLPIDERYRDDGSISRGDKEKYSLRTGATQMMSAVKESGASGSQVKVSEDALIGEMKQGRGKVVAMIGVAVVVVVVIVILFIK